MVDTISTYQELRSFTKIEKTLEELKNYTENSFSSQDIPFKYQQLEDEPFVIDWEKYVDESYSQNIFYILQKYLVQFWFPIKQGISQTDDYKKVTLKGYSRNQVSSATGLVLKKPHQLQVFLHQSLVGKIPVLIVEDRDDFISIVRALTCRNEPHPIPDSMGAAMIKGLNNWDRLKKALQVQPRNPVLKNKDLFQDRLIVLSITPYSNVAPKMMGLEKEKWLSDSIKIRLEHECAHYFTLRHFGKMSNNMHDEIIADYNGISAVLSNYKSDWFLKFIGLENYPFFRKSGRLQNYKGNPVLSNDAFRILQRIIKQASNNIEAFDAETNISVCNRSHLIRLFTLCHVDLVKMSCRKGVDILCEKYKELDSLI